jgi:hypothetical protein
MAHIEIRHQKGGPTQLVINGIDYSMETYHGFEIVEVGDDPELAEVGFRVTFAVSRLDLDGDTDVILTDHVPAAAARVRSMSEVASA